MIPVALPRSFGTTLGALLLVLSFAPSTGCTEAERARFEAAEGRRKRAAAETAIRERADEYWEAVRWRDWSTASTFLEEPDDQVRFLRERTSAAAEATLDNIELQYVFVDPKTFEWAELRVAWTQTTAADPVQRPGQVLHRWYRHHGQWWISPDSLFPPS